LRQVTVRRMRRQATGSRRSDGPVACCSGGIWPGGDGFWRRTGSAGLWRVFWPDVAGGSTMDRGAGDRLDSQPA
jgi:hypothetical protein